jgi:hypothetical protein
MTGIGAISLPPAPSDKLHFLKRSRIDIDQAKLLTSKPRMS